MINQSNIKNNTSLKVNIKDNKTPINQNILRNRNNKINNVNNNIKNDKDSNNSINNNNTVNFNNKLNQNNFNNNNLNNKVNDNNNNSNNTNSNNNINNFNNNYNNNIYNNNINNGNNNFNNNKLYNFNNNLQYKNNMLINNFQNNFNNQISNFNNNMNFMQNNVFNPFMIMNNMINNRFNNQNNNIPINMNQNSFFLFPNYDNKNNNKMPKSSPCIKESSVIINKDHANGLENVGATCYMNATLQCLAHIEHLTKYLLKPEKIKNLLSDKNKYKLTSAYIEVLQKLWLNNDIEYYSPDNFKNIISEMNPLFAGIQANDSKDLVLFLMETIHNELNTPKNNINSKIQNLNQYNYDETFKAFSNYFANNYQSVISNLFYGMYNSMMKCLNCNILTNNVQCFNILIFPLEEVRKFKNKTQNIVDIIECFEYYQKGEFMTGDNQIYCNNCHTYSNSFNMSKLLFSPNILVINLNRGKGLQFDVKLNFGEYLDIKNFIYYNDSPTYYKLIGIVTHFGPSSMGGHFIAFCKSFVDQKWYKYNDAIVNNSSFQEASTTGIPYILFYSYIER